MPIRLTLRVRIIGLIALFAVFLITTFSALLITRQLRTLTANNQYRARVGTFAAKGAFERALLAVPPGKDPSASFQRVIPILQQGQLAEEVTVATLQGKIIATSDDLKKDSRLSERESEAAAYAVSTYSPPSWFYAQIDPQEIDIFLPITLDDVPRYIGVFRYSLGNMAQAMRQTWRACILAALGVMAMMVPLCLLLIHTITGPIRLLNKATREISAGNLSSKVRVTTNDELGELAMTFNEMSSALLRMKERAENANPLTKLPGNNVIYEQIEKRLQTGEKFVAVYSDLDHFKAFNDYYGIGAGDQAIKVTATILREALKLGESTDFLGHQGGDDFILITTPEKADAVTQYICTEFDKRIRHLYKPEDLERGYLEEKDRQGHMMQFPIMTISLAGVTNAHRSLNSFAEVANICAEVKSKAKYLSKESGHSTFYLDRRTGREEPHPTPAPA